MAPILTLLSSIWAFFFVDQNWECVHAVEKKIRETCVCGHHMHAHGKAGNYYGTGMGYGVSCRSCTCFDAIEMDNLEYLMWVNENQCKRFPPHHEAKEEMEKIFWG